MSTWHQPAALASGFLAALAAGSLFVFSDFVGRALADSPDAQAAEMMQRINVQAPRSPLFMAALFLPAVLMIVTAVLAFREGRRAAVVLLSASGAAVFVVGVVLVTIAFHVPRNDALAARDVAQGWSGWQGWWRAWRWGNHVRTVSAAVSSLLLLVSASR